MKLSASRNDPNLKVFVSASCSNFQPARLGNAFEIWSLVSGVLIMHDARSKPRVKLQPALAAEARHGFLALVGAPLVGAREHRQATPLLQKLQIGIPCEARARERRRLVNARRAAIGWGLLMPTPAENVPH